jgi:guanosine-3',5'-bis(diphosphate) 3'-pyrophosphohydrolase
MRSVSASDMLSRESRAALCNGCDALSTCWPEGDNSEEFLEHTKLELFHDQVFCFTPKGKPDRACRAARRRSTFAYAVHTDVGNTAVGAKINGRIAPLASELQNGDEVEIMTVPRGKRRRRPRGSRWW